MINSIILFLLPSIIMGIGFPLALQAWSNYRHKVGQTTGTVYSVNTIGAVVGGLIAGFVLIPVMGVQYSIIALGLLGVFLGSTMIQLFFEKIRISYRIAHVPIFIGVIITAFVIPPDLFKNQFIQKIWNQRELIAVKEGVTTTVSIHKDDKGQRNLVLSGIQVAGDRKGFRVPQKTMGHLGIMLNQNTKRIVSVGFGSGESSSILALHDMDDIDIVEISPEVVPVRNMPLVSKAVIMPLSCQTAPISVIACCC